MKIVEIEDCTECPYGKMIPVTDIFCLKKETFIPFPETRLPPKWCPLPDAPQQADPGDAECKRDHYLLGIAQHNFCPTCGVRLRR